MATPPRRAVSPTPPDAPGGARLSRESTPVSPLTPLSVLVRDICPNRLFFDDDKDDDAADDDDKSGANADKAAKKPKPTFEENLAVAATSPGYPIALIDPCTLVICDTERKAYTLKALSASWSGLLRKLRVRGWVHHGHLTADEAERACLNFGGDRCDRWIRLVKA